MIREICLLSGDKSTINLVLEVCVINYRIVNKTRNLLTDTEVLTIDNHLYDSYV